MVIVGLLLVALACLLVGLVLPSTAWLVASLIASVGAGYVVLRARRMVGAHAVAAKADADAEPLDEADSFFADDAATTVLPVVDDEAAVAPADVVDVADAPANAEPRPRRRSRRKESNADDVPAAELLSGVAPAVVAEPPGEPAAADANPGDVWVIDGRPRYHLATCAIIQGQEAEPIPFDQATEDGFMPCSLCEPNVVRTG